MNFSQLKEDMLFPKKGNNYNLFIYLYTHSCVCNHKSFSEYSKQKEAKIKKLKRMYSLKHRYDENGNEVLGVVSPLGYKKVEMIKQARRLDTLNGKKIALIGGSFMATTTHFWKTTNIY